MFDLFKFDLRFEIVTLEVLYLLKFKFNPMIYKKIVKTRYTRLKARYFETDLNVVKYFSIETSHIGCRLRKIRTHLKTLKRQAVLNIQTDPHSALNDCK